MQRRDFHWGCLTFVTTSVVVIAGYANAADSDWTKPLVPLLQDQCFSCHTAEFRKGALDLERLGADLNDPELLRRWVRIYDRVASGEMPPKGEPRSEAAATKQFLSRLSDSLAEADARRRQTVLRRLNRVEYENTVRDLFGIRVDVKDMLPQDPSAHGFDTIGEILAISPEQMEVYLQAADKAINLVFGSDRAPERVAAKKPMGLDGFASRSIGQLFVKTDDDSLITFQPHWCPSVFLSGQAKVDGTYRVKIKAKTYQTDKPVIMSVYGGDVIVGRLPSHLVGYYDIAPGDEWTVVTFEDYLELHGCYLMKPHNLNASTQGPNRFSGPGLMLGEIEVEGPLEAWPPPSRKQLLGDVDPKAATSDDARTIFARRLPRAFRRQIKPDEIDLYVSLTNSALEAGRPFRKALAVGLQAVLCSPEFLLREEPALPSAKGNETQPADAKRAPATISDDALASRISYFLWSSMPDEELLTLAAAGRLSQPEILRAQVDRLLRDPKSERFVENFTGQWLHLREIDATEPDARQYPEFDEMLRHAIPEETRRFFREILDRDEPLLDFIESDWAILNERLAKHYGIEGVTGQSFRRVPLPPGSMRGGVLTQASVLKVTANGTNTSPVIRGVWVLDNILGQPSPPPPADIPAIEPDIRGATTIREQLEKHRHVASCAACHSKIDPPGFALESFDPIGGWREWYRSLGAGEEIKQEVNRTRVKYRKGPPVDSSGQTADGRAFADIRAFKQLLLADKDQVARCLAGKLLTYAVGRGLGFSDRPAVEAIVASVRRQNFGFRSLIHEVVQSLTFRQK